MKSNNDNRIPADNNKITRKEALKKAGFLALTTATMMVLLQTPAKQSRQYPIKLPKHGRPSRPYPDDGRQLLMIESCNSQLPFENIRTIRA